MKILAIFIAFAFLALTTASAYACDNSGVGISDQTGATSTFGGGGGGGGSTS